MYAYGFLLAGAWYPSNAIQSLKWYNLRKKQHKAFYLGALEHSIVYLC
jgi:hypothetical protein